MYHIYSGLEREGGDAVLQDGMSLHLLQVKEEGDAVLQDGMGLHLLQVKEEGDAVLDILGELTDWDFFLF